MTPPIKATGYVQAGAWATKRADNTVFPNAGVTFGGNLKTQKGFYLNGELGAGTAVRGQIKLGKEFDLGKGFGIDASARAEGNLQLLHKCVDVVELEGKTYKAKITPKDGEVHSVIFEGQEYSVTESNPLDVAKLYPIETEVNEYRSGQVKFSGRVEAVKEWNNAKIKAGVEAGYQYDLNQMQILKERDCDFNLIIDGEDHSIHEHQTASINSKIKGWYLTPTLSGEVNLNKKGNLKLNADLSLNGGQAGIRYVF